MKKKNSIAKFSIGRNTVAKLNTNNADRIVGGATGDIWFNNTRACELSYERSCYGMCVGVHATNFCDAR